MQERDKINLTTNFNFLQIIVNNIRDAVANDITQQQFCYCVLI